MTDASWAHVPDVRGVPATGESADPAFWADYDVDPARYVQGWHSVGEALGVRAFGINACTASAGETVMVEHEEVSFGGQDEVYVVLAGRARFTCDGTEIELGPGGALHCRAAVYRVGVALETPTTVLAVGAHPERGHASSAASD